MVEQQIIKERIAMTYIRSHPRYDDIRSTTTDVNGLLDRLQIIDDSKTIVELRKFLNNDAPLVISSNIFKVLEDTVIKLYKKRTGKHLDGDKIAKILSEILAIKETTLRGVIRKMAIDIISVGRLSTIHHSDIYKGIERNEVESYIILYMEGFISSFVVASTVNSLTPENQDEEE